MKVLGEWSYAGAGRMFRLVDVDDPAGDYRRREGLGLISGNSTCSRCSRLKKPGD
jgi:hypothetical protein